MHRQSDYNYFVPYKDKVIYFNALTRNSFLLKPTEHERMQKQFADPISFELEFPTVFKQFEQWGFFIKEEVDEIAVIRYRHYKEVTFNREYHFIVDLSDIVDADSFAASIKKHLSVMVNEEHIPFLCLEWVGRDLLPHIDICVNPVSLYAKELCDQHHIDFRCQLEIEMADDEVVHDKMYHQKGVPTFRTTLKQVESLCSTAFEYHIYLKVISVDHALERKTDFMAHFSPETRRQIAVDWKKRTSPKDCLVKEWMEKIMLENTTTDRYPLTTPRMYQNTLVYGGNIYCGSPATIKEQVPKGVLAQDGTIKWNEGVRAQLMGGSWMDSSQCRGCKHLPLFNPICSNTYHTSKNYCPVKENLISPECLIVEEFKSKGL